MDEIAEAPRLDKDQYPSSAAALGYMPLLLLNIYAHLGVLLNPVLNGLSYTF